MQFIKLESEFILLYPNPPILALLSYPSIFNNIDLTAKSIWIAPAKLREVLFLNTEFYIIISPLFFIYIAPATFEKLFSNVLLSITN